VSDSAHSPEIGITSDNIHLSEVIQRTSQTACAAVSNPLSFQNCSDPKILEFIAAATAPNTRRAYQSDLRHFLARGGCIPATPEDVARYLADHAGVLAIATLLRRLVAIRSAHFARGLPDPTKSEFVRLTLRGIRRKHGAPQWRVDALSTGDLLAIVRSLDKSPRDIRDAAILLVGFAGAFRRSELAAIDRSDIHAGASGILIQIPRCKTDQEGHGRTVSIPHVQGPICPAAALERWLLISQIGNGPVFRPVTKGGKILPVRISPEAISCILKNRIQAIGRNPARYSGHSLRAGFATEAARIGVPQWRIRAQTGHLSDSTLERYIREGELASIEA